MVSIKTSEKFERIIVKLDKSIKIQLDKLIDKILNNPEIGKPMKYDRKGTKEVYLSPFRLSYSYDKNLDILYLLDFYHKDEQ
ncbi:MAG: type II toxin-antitoxin system RelE/ParE family toxin [Nanoarchaeota archaeon]